MFAKRSLMTAALFAVSVHIAGAQETAPASPTEAALQACAAAAAAGDEAQTRAHADSAVARFDDLMRDSARVADGLTGKARVISQCRVPFAALMRKGALIDDSNELLKRALAIDALHLGARFTLAANHYHVPEFFGRTDDAIRELETLVAQYGSRPIPVMATVYLFLGDVYLRKGRKDDAAHAWRRGQALFPAQAPRFQERLTKAGAAAALGVEPTAASPETASAPIYDMEPLIVEAGRFSVDDTRGAASLKRLDIVTMPGGTADVLQVFQTMPGVTRATEGSDLYVRGGDPAEAPVFVDGARMTYAGAFETLHGGIFGVLDPNGIKKADFSSGGFSAKYGNALSGVLDITSEGRPERASWRAGLNLVSAGSAFRAPLGERAGVWATGKFTETTALLWTQGKGADYPRTPWSLNGMAGVAYKPTPNVEFKLTGLSESDDATRRVDVLGYNGHLRSSGATHMVLASGHALNDAGSASLRGTVSAARRATAFELGVLDRERSDDMYTARVDTDLTPAARVRLRGGIEAVSLGADESGTVPLGAELAPGSAFRVTSATGIAASHVGGYVETETTITPNFAFIAGARTDRLPAADGWSTDPRVALAYRASGWTLRGGAGVFHQGAWRSGYRTPSPGTPSDVATRAKHFVLGVERQAPVVMRLEGYAKLYDEYASVAGSTSPYLVTQGPAIDRGSALGVDALVRWKSSGALSGWASYSYLHGRVRLRDMSEWVPSATDVRHTFTGVAKLAFGDNWEIGSTTRLASGRPFTPILGAITDAEGARSARYGATHSDRLPDYIRIDSRLTRLVPTRNGMFVFYVEGLNLLDRANIMAYTYDSSYTRRVPVESFFASRTLVFGAEAMF